MTRTELALGGILFAVLAVLLVAFGAFDRFSELSRDYENFKLDEILLVAISFAVAAAATRWLATRRQAAKARSAKEEPGRQIAELNKANEALRESERCFRDFAEASADWFWEQDENLRFTNLAMSNPEAPEIIPMDIIGKTRRETGLSGVKEEDLLAHERLLDQHLPFDDFRFSRVRSDGKVVHISVRGKPIFDKRGTFIGYRGTGVDVTPEVEARQRAELEQNRFKTAVENMSDGFALFDPDDRLVFCNEMFKVFNPDLAPIIESGMTFEEMLRDNIKHGRLLDAIGREEEFIRERMERHRNPKEPLLSKRKDGRWLLLREARMADGCTILVNTDLTELKRAEEALHRVQKLEAVGQLTGGIAHDFNNLLAGIMLNAELIKIKGGEDGEIRPFVEQIQKVVDRGKSLTERLLAFSRKQTLSPRGSDISSLLGDLEEMLRRTLGETIDLRMLHAADLWPAMIDPHQFDNALVNLAINARDAMPTGGTLAIATANAVLDQTYARRDDEVAPGDYVKITVSDTGAGMPAEVMEKAFEPFFTTKDIGQGSGLGLSMVYGFVKQSKGHVTIDSEVGRGTTVTLYLPRTEATAVQTKTADDTAATARGSESILVVEDDEDLRNVTVTFLNASGYDVVEAVDGNEALTHLRNGLSFDLLYTDIVLPGGMNGTDIAAEARRVHPHTKVLYATGYADNVLAPDGRLDPGITLIRKPCRREELLAKVRYILDQDAA